MPGFPLMAFGAGLGQWAKQRQEMQEAQIRQQMLALTLSKYGRELDEDRIKNEAAGGVYNTDLGALGGAGAGRPVDPLAGGGVGLPAPPALGPGVVRGADGGLTRNGQPPDTSFGGMPAWQQPRDPGLQQLAQLAPELRRPASPWSGTMTDSPNPLGSLEPGAPGTAPGWAPGGPVGSPNAAGVRDATMPTTPPRSAAGFGAPQMAQAAPYTPPPPSQGAQPQDLAGVNVPPPDKIDFGQIVQGIKQQNPKMSPRAVALFAETVQKRLGENYKQAWEEWKTRTGFRLESGRDAETGRANRARERLTGEAQAETGRHNLVGEGFEGQRVDLTRSGQAETGRHNLASEGLTAGGQAETGRANLATEADRAEQRRQQGIGLGYEGRRTALSEKGQALEYEDKARGRELEAERVKITKDVAEGRLTKVQGEQQLAVTQMRGLAERARDLLDAVEKEPNLVGTIGGARRAVMSVTEQAKLAQYDKQLAEYRAAIKLLQAEAQKPLLGSRYFTKAGLEEIQKIVPSLDKWDSPTEVKAALRGLATTLERKAEETAAVMGGVKKDYQGLSNEELLKQLGVQPGAQ